MPRRLQCVSKTHVGEGILCTDCVAMIAAYVTGVNGYFTRNWDILHAMCGRTTVAYVANVVFAGSLLYAHIEFDRRHGMGVVFATFATNSELNSCRIGLHMARMKFVDACRRSDSPPSADDIESWLISTSDALIRTYRRRRHFRRRRRSARQYVQAAVREGVPNSACLFRMMNE